MIRVLDDLTINKIAAGEVIERPVSVVKELVENSVDAGSSNISVEIKGGGIEYIRVTDNGNGIPYNEVPTAFLRHATSKIASSEDLFFLNTLGFRGEALASIAAVSHTEMITKTKDDLMGTKISYNGGALGECIQTGAPEGTTIIIKDLFYNVPARKKFLNSAQSEGNKIIELMEELVLSNPQISFQLIVNGNVKIQTNGSGNVKDIIFRLYGKETFDALLPIDYEDDFIRMYGFIAKPEIVRPSRSGENYYINGRYVKNEYITRGIEEGYRNYLMQHKFPFVVLFITLDTFGLDVNVHPAKAEIRITNGDFLVDILNKSIKKTLSDNELIPKAFIFEEEKKPLERAPEPFETELIKNSYVIQKGYDKKETESAVDKKDEETEPNDKSKEFTIEFDNIFKKDETAKPNNFMNKIVTINAKSRYDILEEKLKNKEDPEDVAEDNVNDSVENKSDNNVKSVDEKNAKSEESIKTPDNKANQSDTDKDNSSKDISDKENANIKESSDDLKATNDKQADSSNVSDKKNNSEEIKTDKNAPKIVFDDDTLNAIFHPEKSDKKESTVKAEETVTDKSKDKDDSDKTSKDDKANESQNEENDSAVSEITESKDDKAESEKFSADLDNTSFEDEILSTKEETSEKSEETINEPKESTVEISDKDTDDSTVNAKDESKNVSLNAANDEGTDLSAILGTSRIDGNQNFRDEFRSVAEKNSGKVEFRVKTDNIKEPLEVKPASKNINTDIFRKVDRFGSTAAAVKKEVKEEEQTLLFTDKTFDKKKIEKYEILGQIFDTYWLISVENELLIMDQHAAHEKVLYEKFMKKFKENQLETQTLVVAQVASLGKSEMEIYEKYKDEFKKFGFIINDFGDKDLFIRGVPTDLFGSDAKSLFMDILSELMNVSPSMHVSTIEDRIATRACKAAIKGNQKVSMDDCKLLLDYLFTLENPYHCPHGRPTMIKISKTDLEKMFKRIV